MRVPIRSLITYAAFAIASLSISVPAWAGMSAASFTPGTPMHFARAFPTATELLNGNVLRAAGYDGGQFFSDAEIYDWHSGTWTTVAPMHVARAAAVAVRLQHGRVMVIGGFGPGFSVLDSVEIYDPSADTWTITGSLNQRRAEDFLAAVLPDGRVLVAGGFIFANPMIGLFVPTNSAEIWNPDTETWTTVASLTNPREYHSTALLLPDGRVLMAGGGGLPGRATDMTNAEIYSPPYLFKGARPAVTSAPATLGYGSSFFVGTCGREKGADLRDHGSVAAARRPARIAATSATARSTSSFSTTRSN